MDGMDRLGRSEKDNPVDPGNEIDGSTTKSDTGGGGGKKA